MASKDRKGVKRETDADPQFTFGFTPKPNPLEVEASGSPITSIFENPAPVKVVPHSEPNPPPLAAHPDPVPAVHPDPAPHSLAHPSSYTPAIPHTYHHGPLHQTPIYHTPAPYGGSLKIRHIPRFTDWLGLFVFTLYTTFILTSQHLDKIDLELPSWLAWGNFVFLENFLEVCKSF